MKYNTAQTAARQDGRLRVLHLGKFYPPHRGGMESHLELLCREMRELADVRVIVSNDGRKTVEEKIGGIDVARLASWTRLAATSINPAMVLRVNRTPADIVHLHHPNPMATMAYLASGHPGQLVVTYHSDILRQQRLLQLFRPFLNRMLDKSAAIIVSSPDYAASSDVLAPYRDRCHVVPFGLPLEHYLRCDAAAVAEIRARYRTPLILAVGRLVSYKGFEYLIRAMKDVPANLVIVGDGPLRGELLRLAEEMGVSGRVHLIGPVEDVLPYYHASDVFALPSIARTEAFGIVQMEAMACGVPVVNTKLASGVPFVSRHEESGLTVPPEDPPALANALRTLVTDERRRREYGLAARRRVAEEFTSTAMVRRTYEIYERVAQGGFQALRRAV